jgi:hypothetical protein
MEFLPKPLFFIDSRLRGNDKRREKISLQFLALAPNFYILQDP